MDIFAKKFAIPFVVFVTGACVLIIEIIAIRILSPYFGNTIYTVSGVITVVLLALSIGYYAGGKLGDTYPHERIFYLIIAGSGAVVIFLQLLSFFFLPFVAYRLSLATGPIACALVLFFTPNFLLGMLSPFAVKLYQLTLESMGTANASGHIFFYSTLGSIAGSLSAGFFLIPTFGTDKIMLFVGFLLFIVGLFGTMAMPPFFKILTIGTLLVFAFFLVNSLHITPSNVVFNKDSMYQRIIVYQGAYQGQPARFLQQDRNNSAAEFLNSTALAYDYTKYYALYQIFNPNITNALMIGGGAYSVPKDLLLHNNTVHIDVVEIDPMIFEVGTQYFNVPANNPRFENFTQDGRRFLHDHNTQYDFIFSDAYASFFSTPEHLTTRQFFELAKSRLSQNGVFIANVVGTVPPKNGSVRHPGAFVASEIKTFKSVFANSYFFAVDSPSSTKPQNIIFVGYKGANTIDFSGSLVKNDKNPIIAKLPEHIINTHNIDFSNYPILTDAYAPVDYLISKEFTALRSSE